jgi:hypothetical protein
MLPQEKERKKEKANGKLKKLVMPSWDIVPCSLV